MYNTTDSAPRSEGAVSKLAEKLRKRPLKTIGKHKAPSDRQTSLTSILDNLIEFVGYRITDPEGKKEYFSKQGDIHRAYAPFSRYNTTTVGRLISEATEKGKPKKVWHGGQRRGGLHTVEDPLAQTGSMKAEGGTDPRGSTETRTQARKPIVIVRGPGGGPFDLKATHIGKGTKIDPVTNVPIMTRIDTPNKPDPSVVSGSYPLYHKDRFRPRALLKAKQEIAVIQKRPDIAHLPEIERLAEEKKIRHGVLKEYFPDDFDVQAGTSKEWGRFGQKQRKAARGRLNREITQHRNIRAGEARMVRAIIHGKGSRLAQARAQPEVIKNYVDLLDDVVGRRQEQAHQSLSHIERQIQKIAERGYPLVTGASGLQALPGHVTGRVKPIVQPLSAAENIQGGSHWSGAPIEKLEAANIGRHLQAGMSHARIPVDAERVQRLQKNLNMLRDVATKPGEPSLRENIVKSGELFRNIPKPLPEPKGYPYLKKTGKILGGAGLLAGGLYAAKKYRDRQRAKTVNFGEKFDYALRLAREAAEEQAAMGKRAALKGMRVTPAMIFAKRAKRTVTGKQPAGPAGSTGSQVLDFLALQRLKKQKVVSPLVDPSVVATNPEGWAREGIQFFPKGSPPRSQPIEIRVRRVINWHNLKQRGLAYKKMAGRPDLPTDPNSITYQNIAKDRTEAARENYNKLQEANQRLTEVHSEHRQSGYKWGRDVERREQASARKAELENQRVGLVSQQSRRLNRAAAIGVGATAVGVGGGYLIGRRGRRPSNEDHQFSAWSKLSDRIDPDTEGIGHDVATGAIEGGLAYPVSEWAYRKMIGKGKPSTLKKILVGGAVGGIGTGLVGVAVANMIRAKQKSLARSQRRQEMKSKVGMIQFRGREDPPQRTLVAKSRYTSQNRERDIDKANRHYIQSALLGGALGLAIRKSPTRYSKAILTGAGGAVGAQALVRAYGKAHTGPFEERSWEQKRAEKAVPVIAGGALAAKLIGKERLKAAFRFDSRKRPIYFAEVEGYDPNDPLTKASQKWLYKKNYSTEAHAQKIKKWVGRITRIKTDVGQDQAGIQPRDARGRPKKREWEKPWVAAAGTILALKGGLWGANKIRTTIAAAPRESRLGQIKESIQRGNFLRNVPVLGWAIHHVHNTGEEMKRLMYGPSKTPKYATTVVNPRTKKPYSPKQMAEQDKKSAETKYWKDVGSGVEKPENFNIIGGKKKYDPFGPNFSSRLKEIRFKEKFYSRSNDAMKGSDYEKGWMGNPLYPEDLKSSVQHVPIKHIISHQDAVKSKVVKKYKKKSGRELPTLHKVGRKYFVEDGNHRIVSKIEQGEKTVRARVLEPQELRSRLREIRFAETLRDFAISQRSGKTAVVYAPGAQKREREEMPGWKTKRGQRWLWQGGITGTAILGGLGALSYGRRAFRIGREVERANRTIGSTGRDINRGAGEALRGWGPLKVVVRPDYLDPPPNPIKKYDFHSRYPLIRFDSRDQSGGVAVGAGGAGLLVGGLYRGRKALPGEDLTGRRVIRTHSRFPLLQHEGVGTGPSRVTHVVHVPAMGKRGIVQDVSRESFSRGGPVYVMGRANKGAASAATGRVGQELPYTLLRKNCQLFGDECRGAARLTRSFIPRQLRTAITVGGISASGAYGINKLRGRKHEFAAQDDEIDWDKWKERAQVAGGHGIKWGGAAAAVGGVGAAALGAPFLPGAASFLKIPGREIIRKTQTRLARTPLIRSMIKAPKRDPQVFGKSVHDYIEGSQRVLNTGVHGRLIGKGLQTAISDKGSFAGRQLRGRLGMDDWSLKHWSKFRSGHLQALGHWGDEWHDLFQRRSIPHREFAGWGKIKGGAEPEVYKKQLHRYKKGRSATEGEIKDLIENKGFSHVEAFRHVTQKSTNPHIRSYMRDLAQSKKDPFSHYPKLAAVSPALVAGGGAATVGGISAYKRDNER